jgi:hypothetical protein
MRERIARCAIVAWIADGRREQLSAQRQRLCLELSLDFLSLHKRERGCPGGLPYNVHRKGWAGRRYDHQPSQRLTNPTPLSARLLDSDFDYGTG